MNLRMLDLFSGIGGFSLAASWTGEIETVAFCEIDKYATKVLNKNFPGIPVENDIRSLENNGQYKTIDIICGGFPCQPFSTAGKQRGRNDDRDLWPEMFRVIKEFKPDWVIGENVANFVNMELERTITDLENEGYETQSFIIPACGVDAKHERKRVWIVAHSDSERPQRCISGVEIQKRYKGLFIKLLQMVSNANSINDDNAGYGTRQIRQQKQARIQQVSIWKPEPTVGRVANGISARVDRLKCLGNAIVPQVAYPIFQVIVDIEKGIRN